MDDEVLKKYREAGKIISEVREESRAWVKEGTLLADIAEKIEQAVRQKGAEVAFPACLSLNDLAAHYSPGKGDQTAVPGGALLKVDIGAHIDGYIADTAYTIAFNEEHKSLVEAAAAGLKAAIEQCYSGNLLTNVSEAIETTIKDFGFNPISNLTGHGLERYWLHGSPSVPNVRFSGSYRLKEGQAIALEPFATPGAGRVKDSEFITIFRIDEPKPVRNPEARRIIDFAVSRGPIPFSERWLPVDSVFKVRMALRELREKEILYEYPALREVGRAVVSQAEHSLIVGDKPLVITE